MRNTGDFNWDKDVIEGPVSRAHRRSSNMSQFRNYLNKLKYFQEAGGVDNNQTHQIQLRLIRRGQTDRRLYRDRFETLRR